MPSRVSPCPSSRYRVWVRTRDWVATWQAPGAPGKFKVLINDRPLEPLFGTGSGVALAGPRWDGGYLRAGQVSIALRDLTGFNGRCDAILLATGSEFRPPDGGPELAALRRRLLALPESPDDAGNYDLVIGGGMTRLLRGGQRGTARV